MNIDFEKVRYMICQLEMCPGTERLHFQGYAQFFDKMRFKGAASALDMPNAHFEKPRGTLEENQRYCSKEKSRIAGPWESGEAVEQGDRSDLKKACELVNIGRIDLIDDSTYVKYHRGFHQLALRNAKARKGYPHVTVIWGPTGTGKSERAEEWAGEKAYWHPPGQWWDGYTTGQVVVIDDFDPKEWSLTFMLRLLDKYPLKVPYKGGYTEFNSPRIIITSHYAPRFWYGDRWPEIERRICEELCTDPFINDEEEKKEENGAGVGAGSIT